MERGWRDGGAWERMEEEAGEVFTKAAQGTGLALGPSLGVMSILTGKQLIHSFDFTCSWVYTYEGRGDDVVHEEGTGVGQEDTVPPGGRQDRDGDGDR